MRAALTLSTFLLANPVWADDFQLESAVTNAVVFSSGALVTRQAQADIPAGLHDLKLQMPQNAAASFRVAFPEGSGLSIGSVSTSVERYEQPTPTDSPEIANARAKFETAQAALRDFELTLSAARAQKRSAEMRLALLTNIAQGERPLIAKADNRLSAEDFGAHIAELGAQIAQADQDRVEANAALARQELEHTKLKNELSRANGELNTLLPKFIDMAQLVVSVRATAPFKGPLSVTYPVDGVWWQPEYRLDLTQSGSKGALRIERRASITRGPAGEDWHNVQLTLSTAAIGGAMATSPPRQVLQYIAQPQVAERSTKMITQSFAKEMSDAPALVEGNVGTRPTVKGQTIEFEIADRPDVLVDGRGKTQFFIDQIDLDVDLFAKANAASDANAYLYSELTNTTGGSWLRGSAEIYRDGAYLGQSSLPEITNGDSADISLGPLNGLLLERRTVSREEGDRGLISTSSSSVVRYETKVTSLLDYPIPLQLFDHVPVSESEDLKITYALNPKPDERDVDGKRGVMRWGFDMTPGTIKTLKIGHDTVWPEGQQIRQR